VTLLIPDHSATSRAASSVPVATSESAPSNTLSSRNAAVLAAKESPVIRPVNAAKLGRRPRALKAKIGPVTVPEDEEEEEATVEEAPQPDREPTAHTEMQYLLLKLGSDMGLDIWVARNDRKKTVNGHAIAGLPRLKDELPLQLFFFKSDGEDSRIVGLTVEAVGPKEVKPAKNRQRRANVPFTYSMLHHRHSGLGKPIQPYGCGLLQLATMTVVSRLESWIEAEPPPHRAPANLDLGGGIRNRCPSQQML
jgi:hypothetical protein